MTLNNYCEAYLKVVKSRHTILTATLFDLFCLMIEMLSFYCDL